MNKTNCPRCNSVQKFYPHVRDYLDFAIEVYIRCNTCMWERVLRRTTRDLEEINRKIIAVKMLAKYEKGRHGKEAASTIRSLEALEKMRNNCQRKLVERLNGGTTNYPAA